MGHTDADTSEWTFDVSTTRVTSSTNPACPGGNPCWFLRDFNDDPSPYMYRIDSTMGYENIQLVYSIQVHAGSNDGTDESCKIAYNIDNSGDSNWITIATYLNSDSEVDVTLDLPSTTINNPGVGIKVSRENHDGNGGCRIRNWYLIGDLFISSPPTTDIPTESSTELPTQSVNTETAANPTVAITDELAHSQSPTTSRSTATPSAADTTEAITDDPGQSQSPTPSPLSSLVIDPNDATPSPTEADLDGQIDTDSDIDTNDNVDINTDSGRVTVEENSPISNLIYVVIGISAVLAIGCCCIILLCCVKRKKEQQTIEKQKSEVPVASPDSTSTHYAHTNPNVMNSISSIKSANDGPQMHENHTAPNSLQQQQINRNPLNSISVHSPNMEMANFAYGSNVQEVRSASSLITSKFEANLTNLTGANDLLMDDIVDDMEVRGDDVEIITPGNNDNNDNYKDNDITESTNVNDDDVVHQQDDSGDFDDDDDVIGGYETMGGQQVNIKSNHNAMPSHMSALSSHASDDEVIGRFETMGNEDDGENHLGGDHDEVVNVQHYNQNHYDNNNYHQNQFNDGYGNNGLHQNQNQYHMNHNNYDGPGAKKIRLYTDSDMIPNEAPGFPGHISAMNEVYEVNNGEDDDVVIGMDYNSYNNQ